VNADTSANPVHVGGVLGKGLDITITESVSAAVITGNGPGYNTSAGGVAGYIQHSTVSYSQASGAVTLGATWQTGSYDYWQVYAGGLVGYSGGTANGGSSITQSHATGAVSATAPYPYAGGLVGYNYGYITFTGSPAEYAKLLAAGGVTASVTSNGSRITRSYATGNAVAAATANGLPYAGGLAAYSSIPTTDRTPNIENCYARGTATVTTDSKYGWAGGLVGANAQGSVVSTSYATGNVYVTVGANDLPYEQPGVNPGAAGGGIAGVNYYVDETSGDIAALVTHSVALNDLISGTVTSGSTPYLLHRVVGDLGENNTGKLTNNEANRYMKVTPVWNQDIGPDGLDGVDVDAKPPQSVFVNLNWDFGGIWTMGADGYPALR
jgi:hypothetical protein